MVYNFGMIKTLKKILVHLLVFFVLMTLSTTLVFAGDTGTVSGGIPNPLGKTDSLSAFFNGIVSVLIELGTIVSVLGIMYGGYMYATAQGDEEKLGKARTTITWALVGTAVLLGARTIMAAVSGTISQLGTS